MLFAVLENHLAILVACAPSLKTTSLLLFPRLTSSLKRLSSRLTPTPSFTWSLRSKARASIPVQLEDLESGDSRGKRDVSRESEVRMPSPIYGREGRARGTRRGSRGFSRWFDRQGGGGESTEDMGLVYVEHTFTVERALRTPED